MNLKKFYKKYRFECNLEIFIIFILVILYYAGVLDRNSINSSAFVIAALAIPVSFSRYVIEKSKREDEKKASIEIKHNDFYYKILEKLLEISEEEFEKDYYCSNIDIRILQLGKIKEDAENVLNIKISEESDKEDTRTLYNAFKTTLVNILTSDMRIEYDKNNNLNIVSTMHNVNRENKEDLDYNFRNLEIVETRIENYLDKISDILINKECIKNLNSYKEDKKNEVMQRYVNIVLSDFLKQRFNERIIWEKTVYNECLEEIVKDFESNYVFYKCIFKKIDKFDVVLKQNLICPEFILKTEKDLDGEGIIDEFKAGNIINPTFYLNGKDITSEVFVNKDTEMILTYYTEDGNKSRKELKQDNRIKDSIFVKFSTNYEKKEKDSYKSWFTISNKLSDEIRASKETDRQGVFIIDDENEKIVIKVEQHVLKKLLEHKDEDGTVSIDRTGNKNYYIYFYVDKIDEKDKEGKNNSDYIFTDARCNPRVKFEAERCIQG